MTTIDARSNNDPTAVRQSDDELGQLNPSTTEAIVRRGQEALRRLSRSYEDWMDIAEAVAVGRTEAMAAARTNKPTGKRYEKEISDWLRARSFHLIDKGTRNRLLECLKHRAEIEKFRATQTEDERFRCNHPDTVLKKWKAKTIVPAPRKKPSHIAKLKESVARLEEENHRMRREIARSGGDLWDKDDRAEDIGDIMLGKLTTNKAERVARYMLSKINAKKNAAPKRLEQQRPQAEVAE